MSIYDKYIDIVIGECIKEITTNPKNSLYKVKKGEKYRLGVRYNPVVKREVYYLIDIKTALGIPPYVLKESKYFKEEELKSISFILN